MKITIHDENDAWYFEVDEPRIMGGGCTNLPEALQHVLGAIEFAREPVPEDKPEEAK